MTAVEARQLTCNAIYSEPEKVRIVLEMWHRAIAGAAEKGERAVRECAVPKVRTPIPPAARRAALLRLQADGFTVRTVTVARDFETTEVSW